MREKKDVDVEFTRSVADEKNDVTDRDAIDRDRHYGGAPKDDVGGLNVDVEREKKEWEQRYGTEESRDRVGFDGGE